MSRVMVAMSGGVDSSVAAALLRDAGHDVVGVTLKVWGGPSDSGCCSVGDVEDARRVAAQLDIPHYVFDYSDVFDENVVAPYLDAYAHGRTPNPCVECNRTVKFGVLLERADALGFDALATGHHARVVANAAGDVRLTRGRDRAKDQSYVLATIERDALSRVLLPVGEITKDDVRARAASLNLRTAHKAESMDVCFITRGGRAAFLDAHIPVAPGPIVDVDGRAVGTHRGVAHVTVGQRRGLGAALGDRRYVVDVDARSAKVIVGSRANLLRDEIALSDLRFLGPVPDVDEDVAVQTRAHGEPMTGRLIGTRVTLASPAPRVAPGQVVAVYRDDEVVAGGIAA